MFLSACSRFILGSECSASVVSSEAKAVPFFSLLGWKKADMVAVTMFFSLLGWEKADMVAVTMFFSLLGEMESLAFFDVTAPSLRFGWETVQSCLF